MEHRTKFNLNKSIKNWKSELNRNSNMTRDNIEELESHLLDELDKLKEIGLIEKEALILAKNRIGCTENLGKEYSKINKGLYFRNKITNYLKGILIFFTFVAFSKTITNISVLLADNIGIKGFYFNIVSISIAVILPMILAIIGYKKHNSFNMKKLLSFPRLLLLFLLFTTLNIFSEPFLVRVIDKTNYVAKAIILNYVEVLFMLFIVVLSYFIYLKSKNEAKVKIAN